MIRLTVLLLALLAPALTPGNAPAASDAAVATSRQAEVVLAVENMWCPSCPYIVRQALMQVEGVASVEIDYDAKTARVVFDPARASVDELVAATASFGYPSRPLETRDAS